MCFLNEKVEKELFLVVKSYILMAKHSFRDKKRALHLQILAEYFTELEEKTIEADADDQNILCLLHL